MPRDARKSKPKGPRDSRRLKAAIKNTPPAALVDGVLMALPHIDQRRTTAKRARVLAQSIVTDLGCKSIEDMPHYRRQLVSRCVAAAIECERIEAARQNGEDPGDPYVYAAMSRLYSSTLEKLLETKRQPGGYDRSESGAPDDEKHEVNEIRRIIVYPKDAPPADHPAYKPRT